MVYNGIYNGVQWYTMVYNGKINYLRNKLRRIVTWNVVLKYRSIKILSIKNSFIFTFHKNFILGGDNVSSSTLNHPY